MKISRLSFISLILTFGYLGLFISLFVRDTGVSVIFKNHFLPEVSKVCPESSKPFLLSRYPLSKSNPQNRSICIISSDIAGPNLNGGIGTSSTNLARLLASNPNFDVRLVFAVGPYSAPSTGKSFSEWQKIFLEEYNVHLTSLPSKSSFPTHQSGIREVLQSYEAMLWLRTTGSDCDIVHFNEWRGIGFYSLLSSNQGFEPFVKMLFVVMTHSPSIWHAIGNQEYPNFDALQLDYMERTSIQFTDILISPSQYMLDYLTQEKFIFPCPRTPFSKSRFNPSVMIQHLVFFPQSIQDRRYYRKKNKLTIQELVFFGRLEARKGLQVYISAVSLLFSIFLKDSNDDSDFDLPRITFIGKLDPSNSQMLLTNLRHSFPNFTVILDQVIVNQAISPDSEFSLHIFTKMGIEESLSYLSKPGRLAVIPSLIDNSPYTVHETLFNGIPFIASKLPGIAELIHHEDHSVLFEPDTESLLTLMLHILKNGYFLPNPSYDPQKSNTDWIEWHQHVQLPNPVTFPSYSATVSVIMVTHDRIDYVLEALQSIASQTHPVLELILLDDASSLPASLAYLNGPIRSFMNSMNWPFITLKENVYLGSARNYGVSLAKGEYVMFMDDDNIAKQNEIETFVRAMHWSNADVLTCLIDEFTGSNPGHPYTRWLPIGGAVAAGVFTNVFGDANFFLRKSLFISSKGFTHDRTGNEDYEFLAKISLLGYNVQVVPEALFWKRKLKNSMLHTMSKISADIRALNSYKNILPVQVGQALLFARKLRDDSSDYSLLADSVEDFFHVQYYRNWQYEWRVTSENSTWLFRDLEEINGVNENGMKTVSYVWKELKVGPFLMINKHVMHPFVKKDLTQYSSIRTWISNYEGMVTVRGSADRVEKCGDGTMFHIVIAGRVLFSHLLYGKEELFTIVSYIKPKDRLEFIVSPHLNDQCDSVWLYAKIFRFSNTD